MPVPTFSYFPLEISRAAVLVENAQEPVELHSHLGEQDLDLIVVLGAGSSDQLEGEILHSFGADPPHRLPKLDGKALDPFRPPFSPGGLEVLYYEGNVRLERGEELSQPVVVASEALESETTVEDFQLSLVSRL